MLQKLNHKNKNILVAVAMLLILYIAFAFSFSKTIEAISLNNQLSAEQNSDNEIDATLPQTQRKNAFYNTAVKAYHIKKEDRETRLWQTVSSLAVAEGVSISFNPDIKLETDTNDIKNSIARQKFTFKGSYFNLIKLLDTIHKTSSIGKISKLQILSKKEIEEAKDDNRLSMELELVGLEK